MPTYEFEAELGWIRQHMPRLQRALNALPDLSNVRLACSIHLDPKIVPLFEALLARGAAVFLTTCNPATVRDEVVEHLQRRGAQAHAWLNMPSAALTAGMQAALDWSPTHLCEFGAGLTTTLLAQENPPAVRASLEGTGSGINHLAGLALPYPVFNWDDLPIKEGLHNRHMVGLTTWQTFFNVTHLTLHAKQVVVIGYGLVGQGVAQIARAYGGTVTVVERDPARALQAAYDGWMVAPLEEALKRAEVVATATGARAVLRAEHFPLLPDGAFVLNVGHEADEIDLAALEVYPRRTVLPQIEAFELHGRTFYLLAGGAMFNLTAGWGDSLNAFDLTLATLAAGLGYLVDEGQSQPAGVHLLPRHVWQPVLT